MLFNESYEFEAPVLHIGSDSEEKAPEDIKTVDVTDDYEVRTPSPLLGMCFSPQTMTYSARWKSNFHSKW